MDIFEQIIEKLKEMDDTQDIIAQLEEARAGFADPTTEEAQKAAMAIFKGYIDAQRAKRDSQSDNDDDGESDEAEVSEEEKVLLEQAVETVKTILKKKVKCRYECVKRSEDMYVITFEPRYEFCTLDVEIYVEANPLACYVRINLPIVVDPIYTYIVSEHFATMNRKSSRYGTYAINPKNGTVECRYRMRYDGGLNAEAFSAVLFKSIYDADDNFIEIRKLAVGKLKKDQKSKVIKKVKDLVTDMDE